jgi:hypothetical protein
VAVATVRETTRPLLGQHSPRFAEIVFCCFSHEDLELYQALLAQAPSR